MIETSLLEQLVTFASCETLSETAERLHTSQPALTRSMKKLEEELGISLFIRKKNQIVLNETGKVAVSYAERVLQDLRDFEMQTIAYDRSLHTIHIGYCAPIPQRVLTPIMNNIFKDITVSADMKSDSDFLEKLNRGFYQLVVVHEDVNDAKYFCKKIGSEHLFLNVANSDPLAFFPQVHLQDLENVSILLLSQIGFWMDVVKESSGSANGPNFIIQYEQTFFNELARLSSLPFFTSSVFLAQSGETPGRINIPLADPSCRTDYYLVCKKEDKGKFKKLFDYVREDMI